MLTAIAAIALRLFSFNICGEWGGGGNAPHPSDHASGRFCIYNIETFGVNMLKYSQLKSLKKFSLQTVIPALEKAGYSKKATMLYYCGTQKHLALCQGCHSVYFNGANTCKDRFCPICNKKRSLLYLAKIYPILADLLDKGYYINIVNYTIKDTENLKQGIDILQRSFRMLTHEDKVYRKKYKESFVGGIKSLEIKTGKNSGLWHPHFHSIVVKKKNTKDFDWLKEAWETCTSKVAGTNEKIGSVWLKGFSSKNKTKLLKSVLETLKYITKFDWDVTEKVSELVETLSGVRTINTYGILRGLQPAEKDLDKSIEDITNIVCKICGCTDFVTFDAENDYINIEDF